MYFQKEKRLVVLVTDSSFFGEVLRFVKIVCQKQSQYAIFFSTCRAVRTGIPRLIDPSDFQGEVRIVPELLCAFGH